MQPTELTRTFSGESTVELLEMMRGGDSDAMDRLFLRYLPILKRWAHGRLPSYARDLVETDDLVQEALLGTLRQLPSFEYRFNGAFHAYMCRGVKNRIHDEIRRRHREPRGQYLSEEKAPPLVSEALSPLEEAIGRDLHGLYQEALQTLRPMDQEAIVARLELVLPYADIALALDKPSPDAARMAVTRAIARLVQAIERLQKSRVGLGSVNGNGDKVPEA
ncbi:MAG: sigma-70 family RNA polymerase sigma factor [Acidobacteriota bacterium]